MKYYHTFIKYRRRATCQVLFQINISGYYGDHLHLVMPTSINPPPAKLNNLKFHPLEVVSRYRDPQLQVAENYPYLSYLTSTICKS